MNSPCPANWFVFRLAYCARLCAGFFVPIVCARREWAFYCLCVCRQDGAKMAVYWCGLCGYMLRAIGDCLHIHNIRVCTDKNAQIPGYLYIFCA
jgi:hypothetical protein